MNVFICVDSCLSVVSPILFSLFYFLFYASAQVSVGLKEIYADAEHSSW